MTYVGYLLFMLVNERFWNLVAPKNKPSEGSGPPLFPTPGPSPSPSPSPPEAQRGLRFPPPGTPTLRPIALAVALALAWAVFVPPA